MAGGPVYQATTETYESSGRWRVPSRLLAVFALLVAASVAVTLGLKLMIVSSWDGSTASLVIGILLFLLGLGIYSALIFLWLKRRGGCPDGKQGIEAGCGVTGANLGAPNPSTDPLVTAQYAPVRDAPPADDERRQLMDNKECLSSAEESDRMIESDPRIVLRPLKNVEEA